MTTRYVALLRGINLGPSRRIAMPALRDALTERGYEGVRTLLASGNVVLESDLPEPKLTTALTKAIAEDFGLDVPVVLRTGKEMAEVLATDPFGDVATDTSRYSVTFLPEPPHSDRVKELPPAEDGKYAVLGRELFLWLPDGMARSAMAKWNWDRMLGVAGTNRNWNTVAKLAEVTA